MTKLNSDTSNPSPLGAVLLNTNIGTILHETIHRTGESVTYAILNQYHWSDYDERKQMFVSLGHANW